jgi:hypothetical protein
MIVDERNVRRAALAVAAGAILWGRLAAADELVIHGARAKVAAPVPVKVEADHALVRAEIERYIHSISGELKIAPAPPVPPAPPPAEDKRVAQEDAAHNRG